MGGMRRKPADADAIKEAADQWFAAFFVVRTLYPTADVWAQIAATDFALRTK